MDPKHAIVREIGNRYKYCLSTPPMHHSLNVELARKQHSNYCSTLRELGLEIINIPRDDEHPDSVFVEDNAVVHNKKALICRMAKPTRRGEEEGVEEVLKKYLDVKRATSPAT